MISTPEQSACFSNDLTQRLMRMFGEHPKATVWDTILRHTPTKMTRRQNFTEKEKNTIFRMKSNNCTRKSISLALNACPKSVDSVIRRDRLNDALPP